MPRLDGRLTDPQQIVDRYKNRADPIHEKEVQEAIVLLAERLIQLERAEDERQYTD
jgi:hypothetical protein